MNTFSQEKYLEAGQAFHWGSRRQFVLWLTGREGRHKRTEVMLPRLVRKKKLTWSWYSENGEKAYKVYSVPRRNKKRIGGQEWYPKIAHGLGCTEGLVRFKLSNHNMYIIPERKFRGHGWAIPEWGIRYPVNRSLLLYEYCTTDNWSRRKKMEAKIEKYKDTLHEIKEKFDADSATVLFVADASRWDVDGFVQVRKPIGGEFRFTDYETFLDTPYGQQLYTPIYISGKNGFPYSLRAGS